MKNINMKTIGIVSLILAFATISLAGHYNLIEEPNPFTGTFDYVLDGDAIYNDIQAAGGATTAAQVSYSNPAYGSYSTVQKALDGLLYAAPSSLITTISSPGLSIERGNTTTSVTINWQLTLGTKALTIQNLTWSSGGGPISIPTGDRTYVHSTSFVNTNRTYTMTVSDGTSTVADASSAITYYYRKFWGNSANATLTDTQIKELANSTLQSGRTGTHVMTPSNEYMYFSWVSSAGAPTWTVNGLPNTAFTLVRNDTFVNAYGESYTIRLYRSNNLLTGTYTVVIS